MTAIVDLVLIPWVMIAVVLAWSIITAAMVENERYFAPLVILAAFILIHDFFTAHCRFVDWIAAHWMLCALFVVIYVPIGCLYSLFRWTLYCREQREQFDRYIRTKAKRDYENKGFIFDGYLHEGKSFDDFIRDIVRPAFLPDVDKCRAMLIGWIGYWPTSAAWYMLHDALAHVLNDVYRRMSGVYAGIRDRSFDEK